MNLKTDFIEAERERFRMECNFTPEELNIFDLRTKGYSYIEIQDILNISESTVTRRLRNIKWKINRVMTMVY